MLAPTLSRESNSWWDHFLVLTNSNGLPFVEDGYHYSLAGSSEEYKKKIPNPDEDTTVSNLIIFPQGEKNNATIYAAYLSDEDTLDENVQQLVVDFGKQMRERFGDDSVSVDSEEISENEGEENVDEDMVDDSIEPIDNASSINDAEKPEIKQEIVNTEQEEIREKSNTGLVIFVVLGVCLITALVGVYFYKSGKNKN